MKNKVLLMILDGWGKAENSPNNAVSCAATPNLDKLEKENSSALLKTCGTDVGLEEGIMGNSEVGHLNIGAGRIVWQLNSLINNSIKEQTFFENKALLSSLEHCQKFSSNLHIFGLLSDGKVHSNPEHLFAFLKLCKKNNFQRVFFHCLTDGRDTLTDSGIGFIKEFLEKSQEIGVGKIASISGRYYAMDRDNRWERVKKAYDCFVFGEGEIYDDPIIAMQESYEAKISDEFILPKMIKNTPRISDNDSIFFFNFRADRARQLTRSFILPDFKEFETKKLNNLNFVSLSEYDINFEKYLKFAYKLPNLNNILGQVLQDNHKTQLRIAETEKYAHVTFFFNGSKEAPFIGEERILIPSPKVASYDLQPEMSAFLLKDKLKEVLADFDYDVIILNFANCDMVGHTGNFEATIKAVETVDQCVGEIVPLAKEKYHILITADHGNAEKMRDEKGNIFTAHSTNPVKIIYVNADKKAENKIKNGRLADISPTILKLMDIKIPSEMTGKTLL